MLKVSKYIGILLLPILFSGCLLQDLKLGTFKIPDWNNTQVIDNIKDERNLIPKIIDSLKNASKEDCQHHAKFYIGLSEYIKNVKTINTTGQIAPPNGLVVVVQKNYGWTIGKNKEFTDLIEADMTEYLKLKTPTNIDDSLREKIVNTLRIYGEGAWQASLTK